MSMQDMLLSLSSISFALCGALLVLAVRTYVKQDMRAVFDDLSGRRRQRGIATAMLAAHEGRPSAPRPRVWTLGGERPGTFAGTRAKSRQHPNDATLVAKSPVGRGAHESADETLVAQNTKFSITHKTVLCGTADVVEGRGGQC